VAALVSSFFGGSFSAALPVIGPFAVANRTPDVPRMVVFPFHSDIQAAAISKDNTTMFIVDRFNNVVRVIDLSAREQTSTITVGRPPIVNSANSAPPDGTVVAGIRPTSIMVSPVKNDYRAFVTGRLTRIVVLSACETAVFHEMKEDNVNQLPSLALSFTWVGIPSVFATLWRVEDKATSILMETFYRNLKNKMGLYESLRVAQTEMIEGGAYTSPYYWASVILFGAWL
jgi:YVTN family beta-propeller protein